MALGSTPSHINHILRRLRIREGEVGGGGQKVGLNGLLPRFRVAGALPLDMRSVGSGME